jgi:hypothetical protein
MKDETRQEISATIAKKYTDWMVKTGGYARDKTLRDEFAARAMQGVLIEEGIHDEPDIAAKWIEEIAKASYQMADAMLKERAK